MQIFIEGFKKLCDATGMYKIKINTNSILDLKNSQLNFDDNSMVDIKDCLTKLDLMYKLKNEKLDLTNFTKKLNNIHN